MNKLILAAALSTSMAHAELWEMDDASAYCDNTETMVNTILQEYAEVPMLTGEGYIYTGVEPIKGQLMLWLNMETNDYTITVTLAEAPEISCILTTGLALRAYNPTETSL